MVATVRHLIQKRLLHTSTAGSVDSCGAKSAAQLWLADSNQVCCRNSTTTSRYVPSTPVGDEYGGPAKARRRGVTSHFRPYTRRLEKTCSPVSSRNDRRGSAAERDHLRG